MREGDTALVAALATKAATLRAQLLPMTVQTVLAAQGA
jgi:hypothetical protein